MYMHNQFVQGPQRLRKAIEYKPIKHLVQPISRKQPSMQDRQGDCSQCREDNRGETGRWNGSIGCGRTRTPTRRVPTFPTPHTAILRTANVLQLSLTAQPHVQPPPHTVYFELCIPIVFYIKKKQVLITLMVDGRRKVYSPMDGYNIYYQYLLNLSFSFPFSKQNRLGTLFQRPRKVV